MNHLSTVLESGVINRNRRKYSGGARAGRDADEHLRVGACLGTYVSFYRDQQYSEENYLSNVIRRQ